MKESNKCYYIYLMVFADIFKETWSCLISAAMCSVFISGIAIRMCQLTIVWRRASTISLAVYVIY